MRHLRALQVDDDQLTGLLLAAAPVCPCCFEGQVARYRVGDGYGTAQAGRRPRAACGRCAQFVLMTSAQLQTGSGPIAMQHCWAPAARPPGVICRLVPKQMARSASLACCSATQVGWAGGWWAGGLVGGGCRAAAGGSRTVHSASTHKTGFLQLHHDVLHLASPRFTA